VYSIVLSKTYPIGEKNETPRICIVIYGGVSWIEILAKELTKIILTFKF
jgi:hypothetical protein